MKSRSILFSAPMVRADLAGIKTQTRRVMKPQPTHFNPVGVPRRCVPTGGSSDFINCPYGEPGDQLWVRETYFAWGRWETRYSAKKGRDEWHFIDMTLESGRKYLFAADNSNYKANLGANKGRGLYPCWWQRPAIFMPRAASRITMEITAVRVERLQDISEADAIAEGIEKTEAGFWSLYGQAETDGTYSPIASYRALWQSINGPDSWDLNPLVWVIEFRLIP